MVTPIPWNDNATTVPLRDGSQGFSHSNDAHKATPERIRTNTSQHGARRDAQNVRLILNLWNAALSISGTHKYTPAVIRQILQTDPSSKCTGAATGCRQSAWGRPSDCMACTYMVRKFELTWTPGCEWCRRLCRETKGRNALFNLNLKKAPIVKGE